MESATTTVEALRAQITATELQLDSLKKQLAQIEKNEFDLRNASESQENSHRSKWPLSQEEYKRYGRQMIVPGIGIQGTCPLFTPFAPSPFPPSPS
jgi:adenylyltransferase/sulfurtransferase